MYIRCKSAFPPWVAGGLSLGGGWPSTHSRFAGAAKGATPRFIQPSWGPSPVPTDGASPQAGNVGWLAGLGSGTGSWRMPGTGAKAGVADAGASSQPAMHRHMTLQQQQQQQGGGALPHRLARSGSQPDQQP